MAKLFSGAPPKADHSRYLIMETAGVRVYYPPGLGPRDGFTQIEIRLKKFFFIKWLELEGAKALIFSTCTLEDIS